MSVLKKPSDQLVLVYIADKGWNVIRPLVYRLRLERDIGLLLLLVLRDPKLSICQGRCQDISNRLQEAKKQRTIVHWSWRHLGEPHQSGIYASIRFNQTHHKIGESPADLLQRITGLDLKSVDNQEINWE